MTRWPRLRLIFPKLAIVCGVKSKPLVTSQALTVPPAPLGTLGTVTRQVVSSVRLMSPPTIVLANAWLNRLKNPTRNCSFWSPLISKFLNRVRSVFVRVGVRMLYGGTRSPISPKAGTEMQFRSRIFSPTSLPSRRGSQV